MIVANHASYLDGFIVTAALAIPVSLAYGRASRTWSQARLLGSLTVLVTGGAGFIGSNFIRYVLANEPEASVTNLDLLTYAGVRSTVDELDALGQTLYRGEFDSLEELKAKIRSQQEAHEERRVLVSFRWGLLPPWAPDRKMAPALAG
mgnify:CR=1 FL=1